jgi:hypothetical protein
MMLGPRSTRQSGLTKARRRDGEVEAVLSAKMEPAERGAAVPSTLRRRAKDIAAGCNRSQISRSGDDAVTDSLQVSSHEQLVGESYVEKVFV